MEDFEFEFLSGAGPADELALAMGRHLDDPEALIGKDARLRLRTLGRVDLRAAGDEEASSVLSQPKRTALLCYLALASPVGYHRRDTLLALFWPDLDTSHARGALNQAVRYLRRALGSDVIVSRGNEDIGVNATSLWCDAVAFRYAAATGRFLDALALYAGPLLDGFFVQDAPALDSWLEAERRSLILQAERVAWRVAEQGVERGDRVEAGLAAMRAAHMRPHDESVHQRLLSFLVDIGDRSGALRAHAVFCRRLARDLDIGPTPETDALVRDIRNHDGTFRPGLGHGQGLSGPVEMRAGASDTLTELLVHDFRALGEDHAHQAFAVGLSEDVRATLSSSKGIRLIAHDQRLALPPDANGNRRAPGPRRHRMFVLRGSVRIVDGRLRVVARLNCTRSGHTVWTDTYDSRIDDTLDIQRGLAARISTAVEANIAA